jgi:hypothetical protein
MTTNSLIGRCDKALIAINCTSLSHQCMRLDIWWNSRRRTHFDLESYSERAWPVGWGQRSIFMLCTPVVSHHCIVYDNLWDVLSTALWSHYSRSVGTEDARFAFYQWNHCLRACSLRPELSGSLKLIKYFQLTLPCSELARDVRTCKLIGWRLQLRSNNVWEVFVVYHSGVRSILWL